MNAYRMKECTMSNKERAKALAYIKKCEEGKKGKEFKDFEKKVVSYIEVRATGAYPVVWNYLFVEYVLLEVVSKNQMNALATEVSPQLLQKILILSPQVHVSSGM